MDTLKQKLKTDITDFLHDVIISRPDTIRAHVAKEALSYSTPESFFHDILKHGCRSGMVISLIYHADTHEFFDKHYNFLINTIAMLKISDQP